MVHESQSPATFQVVVAAANDLGIGKNGQMPWSLPGDMAYFKRLTSTTSHPSKQNAVIMGRKTWDSIPHKYRPLKDRLNIVLTRSTIVDENSPAVANTATSAPDFKGAITCESLAAALDMLTGTEYSSLVETVFVIGGGQVYKEAVASPLCAAVHLTKIDHSFDCDTFFPALDPCMYRMWSSSPVHREGEMRYEFQCFTRVDSPQPPVLPPAIGSQHEEQQYLELVDRIVKMGVLRGDRTGTGTLSIFGCQARYNLRHTFPLLTTKRVFWRGVVEELLWFVKGSTNATELQDKGVHIWDGNSSRQYLDSIGLTDREEGDLGPVYGFQWRHFGAEYRTMHDDYTGQGVDQLAEVVHKLKNNPTDRRIIMSAWNPAALRFMALPPCHMFCQFYVADGELSCLMYQRSCDVGLGVPFNIASYSLLTCMLAQVCGLKAGEFVHCMGDTHVYTNHVEPLQQQLRNHPRHFPTLKINPSKTDIDSFTFDDFELLGYSPHKKIEMKMAV